MDAIERVDETLDPVPVVRYTDTAARDEGIGVTAETLAGYVSVTVACDDYDFSVNVPIARADHVARMLAHVAAAESP